MYGYLNEIEFKIFSQWVSIYINKYSDLTAL